MMGGAIGSIGKAMQNFATKGSMFTMVGKISPFFYIHFPMFYN